MPGIMIALGRPKNEEEGSPSGMAPRAKLNATGGRAPSSNSFGTGESPQEETAEHSGGMSCPECGCALDLVKKESSMEETGEGEGVPSMPGGGV